MFKTIRFVIAWIVGIYSAFRSRKPEPFEPKEIDVTLDLEAPE